MVVHHASIWNYHDYIVAYKVSIVTYHVVFIGTSHASIVAYREYIVTSRASKGISHDSLVI